MSFSPHLRQFPPGSVWIVMKREDILLNWVVRVSDSQNPYPSVYGDNDTVRCAWARSARRGKWYRWNVDIPAGQLRMRIGDVG